MQLLCMFNVKSYYSLTHLVNGRLFVSNKFTNLVMGKLFVSIRFTM